MTWGYALAMLVSILLAPVSMLAHVAFNPPAMFGMYLAIPIVRLFGREPASWDTLMWIALFWPLIVVPLHYLNYVVLAGGHWKYAALLLGGVLSLSIAIAFYHS